MKLKSTVKKQSIGELTKETIVLEQTIDTVFDYLVKGYHKELVLVAIWESFLKLRIDGGLTQNEFNVEFAKLISVDEDATAEDLVALYADKNINAVTSDMSLMAFQTVLSLKNAAETENPLSDYKKENKPTKRELLRRVDSLTNRINKMVDEFSIKLKFKTIHKELIESVCEQHANEERTNAELRSWYLKWDLTRKGSNKTHQELCEHLEVPDLDSIGMAVEKNINDNLWDLVSNAYNSHLIGYKKTA